IRRLGTDTAIYGVSTIVGRFLSFLLVPFYTNVLHPGENGVVAYVYSLLAFLNVVWGYGMESAYFKYSSTGEIGTPGQNFSTPFLSLCVTSLLMSGLMAAFFSPIARWMDIPSAHVSVIPYAAAILFLDTCAIVPFASLRMGHRPLLFASLKVLNIVVNVACNIVFLLVFRLGVEGIFLSGAIASGVTLLTLAPTIARQFTGGFSVPLYRALLKFGLPYVPAGLASIVIQVIDRPIMLLLTSLSVVGVYQVNYRLGIFMMLVVSMYDFAWRPFFLAHAAEKNAKELFARALTYSLAVMAAVFLGVSLFIGDIVRIRLLGRYVIHPDYWSGLPIVPVVLLGYLFLGVYNNLIAGVYIEKKTQRLPAITLAGALVNIGANFLLIPLMGMMGGAVATLLAYAAMATVLFVDVRGYYPVAYEWGRIARLALAGAVSFLLYMFIDAGAYEILWKCFLLVLFVVLLFLLRFFLPEELHALARWTKRGAQTETR
ncbi:MAG TPA: oligosaccharide flippase family protein, partial [Bacteroidota bacterium]|nr:oligosaccharide flippase family protein [Bacteroidota bacterium]